MSNTQRALSALRELIFQGELPAGSDHLETDLADRLGMSRTPVREAARTLASQGLVEIRPRKGVRISPVSPDDMREVYDVLTELESLAAEQAALQSYTNAEMQILLHAVQGMEQALARGNLSDWAEADDSFHTELMSLGGNSRAIMMAQMMSDQVRRARSITLFMREAPVKSNEDHRRVYEAIRAGDSVTARKCHRQHRQNSKKELLDLLAKHHLRRL